MNDRAFDRITRGLAGTTSRRGALKLLGGGIVGGALAGTGVLGLSQVTAGVTPTSPLTVPISGTGALGSFLGTFTLDRVVARAGQLVGVGTLVGTLTTTATGATQAINQVIELPLTVAQATCEILDLTLGPINLDLLGLVITTNAIHINITAQSGPGNLLGNLLCAVANLLNGGGGGPLAGLARLLNRILAILG